MTQESAILERYLARTPKSAALNAQAKRTMPGTRSTAWFAPYPPFVAKGNGAELVDVDGPPRDDSTVDEALEAIRSQCSQCMRSSV
jgi:hypothetical protein